MALEKIRRRGYPQADRQAVEESVAKAVESNPETFIKDYVVDERSFNGRYVAADLFKETFVQYRQSKESRNRYNAPVHNTAAVLSAEQFRRMLTNATHPERDTVVLLTGIPGAGKTSSVLAGGEIPAHYRMIFEGQLSNVDTSKDKIQQILSAGLKPVIIAVHAKPENALANTLKRFTEEGRGASIDIMSQIQGNLPNSLREIQKIFGGVVELKVFDYRDRENPIHLTGWNHLTILESEGNYEKIKRKLSSTLEELNASGAITEAAYRQANGEPPLERNTMDRANYEKYEKDDSGRKLSSRDSEKTVLNEKLAFENIAQVAKTQLGLHAKAFPAQLADGIYKGPMIAENEHYILQKISSTTTVAHMKTAFVRAPEVNNQQSIAVLYHDGKADMKLIASPVITKKMHSKDLGR